MWRDGKVRCLPRLQSLDVLGARVLGRCESSDLGARRQVFCKSSALLRVKPSLQSAPKILHKIPIKQHIKILAYITYIRNNSILFSFLFSFQYWKLNLGPQLMLGKYSTTKIHIQPCFNLLC